MKRIAILLLSALTLLTLLTGCIHEDFGIKLNADGTGSVSARIGIDKDVYSQALGMGADLFGDSEAEPTEYEYRGKTYVSVTETTEYASFDELKQALLDLTYETDELAEMNSFEGEWEIGDPEEEDAVLMDEPLPEPEDEAEAEPEDDPVEDEPSEDDEAGEPEGTTAETIDNHIFKDVVIERNDGLFSKSLVFSAKMNAIPDDPDAETPLSSAFLVSVSVEMPNDITNASENAAVDGNKAVFEINDLTVENEFAVESTQNNTEIIVAIVAVLVLVLIGLIIFSKVHGKDKE
jgi:hypothetical protein